MKTLHIVNKSPDQARFGRCLAALEASDQLLLTENAVIALADAGIVLPSENYALAADLEARGLAGRPTTTVIDYPGMVRLTADADRIICW
ncbi:sulfurtransferase complex subunit TusB [Marinobacter mobilis]|uniref:tRNA 2-thiouridine synthesizing protein B n=1 Tax=Marinobacter mobilis TaxID=488533 RepID=A0A1H2V796_9GAMM|nr:sulfurtransferase complex subunit TusB [Marinobacter mobilis]SDW64203.1 tRNA 2-thiouridine synthesizing protein B [Marinobacter mobilis]